MRFVRWLGAFAKASSLTDSGVWEHSQTDRQVAVEPLWHGLSLISHAKVGLELDERASLFVRGWLYDAYTRIADDGTLRSDPTMRRGLDAFRNMDRFLAKWSKTRPNHHAEAAFSTPVYRAVVVKANASQRGRARAAKLAAMLNLPIKEILP